MHMIPSRKIIVFMDFDGVLNSNEFFRQRNDNGNGRELPSSCKHQNHMYRYRI